MLRLGSRVLLFLSSFALLSGLMVTLSAPVQADVPTDPAVAPFVADGCEGTTTSDPTRASGAVANLTRVFGQRLDDYNAGKAVMLYGNSGTNGGTPNCGLHYSAGEGDVAEWMYCTDHSSKTCSVTDAVGRLVQQGQRIGSMENQRGNARLSADQELVVNFLIHNNRPVTVLPYQLAGTATTASNDDDNTRLARQFLVWCVTDRADFDINPGNGLGNHLIGEWCDDNIDRAAQDDIVSSVPDVPQLDLAAVSPNVEAGRTTELKLTTNLLGQTISLDVTGGAVTICDPTQGVLVDDELIVAGSDSTRTVDVRLCATSADAGEIAVTATANPVSSVGVRWVQSRGVVGGVPCQVYAVTTKKEALAVSASVRVLVNAAAPIEGGFEVVKVLTGAAASSVPATTVFTVEYTVDGGAAQQLTVPLGGAATTVSKLASGAEVTIGEIGLPKIEGVAWATPVFNVDGVNVGPSATFTIVGGRAVEVGVTNTAEVPAVEGAPADPVDNDNDGAVDDDIVGDDSADDDTAGDDEGVVAAEDEQTGALPSTGLDASVIVASLAGIVMLISGGALVMATRRKSART